MFTLLVILAFISGFYIAWNIGGSAVVNSMGTSIGSRVLSLRNVILIAVLSCFLGSVLVGIHVTEVIGEGIVNPDYFSFNSNILLYGMLSALITTAFWISIAT